MTEKNITKELVDVYQQKSNQLKKKEKLVQKNIVKKNTLFKVLEKKIDIQSSLLINNKNAVKNYGIAIDKSRENNRSQGKFYETSNGFLMIRDRPQSKQ